MLRVGAVCWVILRAGGLGIRWMLAWDREAVEEEEGVPGLVACFLLVVNYC